jgi:hypothetical protein
MKHVLLVVWLLAAAALAAFACTASGQRDQDPEQLIESTPTGAGPAEIEQRPGYFHQRKTP